MFDDSYEIETKGIPVVSYYKEINVVNTPQIFTEIHYHSDFEILYITEGKAKMIVNTNTFFAEKGSVILINPYEVHYGEVLSNNFSYYCIDFGLSVLSLSNEEKILAGEMKYINHIENANLKTYIEEICACYTEELPGWEMRATGNLMILFSYFENSIISTDITKENEFAKKVINYIDENYMKSISSKTAAEELSYNQSYFCRMFRKNFSLKFSDYLSIYRIKKAKEILKKESVSNAAMHCGFSSISYFSLEFKKRCGISPREFQKKLR